MVCVQARLLLVFGLVALAIVNAAGLANTPRHHGNNLIKRAFFTKRTTGSLAPVRDSTPCNELLSCHTKSAIIMDFYVGFVYLRFQAIAPDIDSNCDKAQAILASCHPQTCQDRGMVRGMQELRNATNFVCAHQTSLKAGTRCWASPGIQRRLNLCVRGPAEVSREAFDTCVTTALDASPSCQNRDKRLATTFAEAIFDNMP